jgi:hypothetical protein
LPSRLRREIEPEKYLIPTVWSPSGLHNLFVVPKGQDYNPTFFANVVVPDSQTDLGLGTQRKTLEFETVHWTTHPVQFKVFLRSFRGNCATRVPHPAGSPDIAPNDFCLFSN